MVCRYCGAQVDEGDLFCAGCGAPLEEAAAESAVSPLFSPGGSEPHGGQPPRPARGKRVPNRRLLLFSSLGALVLLAAVAAVLLLRRPGGTVTDVTRLEPDCLYLINSGANYEKIAVYSGTALVARADASYSFDLSMDRKVFSYVDTDGTLWRVTAGATAALASGVERVILSDDGGGAAFQTTEGTVCHLADPSGTPVLLSGDCSLEQVVLSPSGSAAAFTAGISSSAAPPELMLSLPGRDPVKVCSQGVPIALSDDGLLYYYQMSSVYDNRGDLYAYRDGVSTLLAERVLTELSLSASRDHRELIFTSLGKCYLARDGAELILLSEAVQFFPGTPNGAASRLLSLSNHLTVFPADSFAGSVFYSQDGLYYLDGDYFCTKLTDPVYSYAISADRSQMLCQTIEGDFLLLPDLRGGEPPRLLLRLRGYYACDAAPDLSIVYYQESFDGGGPIRSLDLSGNTALVTERAEASLLSGYTGVFYFLTDGRLHYILPGESEIHVVASDTAVLSLFPAGPRALCYFTDGQDGWRPYCEESPGVFVPLETAA